MSHEVESMFSVKQVPWHGLGKIIEDSPSIADGIKLAGLDWRVDCHSLKCSDGTIVSHRAVRRSDTGAVLGVVGPDYTPLQNQESFDWFEPFIESGLAKLTTAGSLREGKRVWILAKLNQDGSEIVKGDIVEKFILLSNGHDGTLAVRVGFTPVRVVCANTLRLAITSEASKMLRVRHRSGVKRSIDKLRDIMNLANQEFEATADQFRFLAKSNYNQEDVIEYVKKLLDIDDNKEISTRTKNICEDIFKRIVNGMGTEISGVRGTWWAAYNGFTEYLNYENGNNTDNRMSSLWFGQNEAWNKQALELAMDFANAA